MIKQVHEIKGNYEKALSEFTRLSGTIEGTLDTLIAMIMDTSPEISMPLDRLIKIFHNLEGLCSQGLKAEMDSLITLAEELIAENKNLKQEISKLKAKPTSTADISLESAISQFKKKGQNDK